MSLADETHVFPAESLRCWSWRDRHGCGCRTADDCMLAGPLPVHDHDRECSGRLSDGGRWLPHCAPTGTGTP